jgi:hypothetical protein
MATALRENLKPLRVAFFAVIKQRTTRCPARDVRGLQRRGAGCGHTAARAAAAVTGLVMLFQFKRWRRIVSVRIKRRISAF